MPPHHAPKPKAVEVAGGDAQVRCHERDVGGEWFVLEQGSRQALAGLDIPQQALEDAGRVLEVFHRRSNGGSIARDHPVQGPGELVHALGEGHQVAARLGEGGAVRGDQGTQVVHGGQGPLGGAAQVAGHGREVGESLLVEHVFADVANHAAKVFNRLVQALNQPAGRALEFIEIERRLRLGAGAVRQYGTFVFGGDDGDIFIAQQPGRLNHKAGVGADFVAAVDLERQGRAFAVGIEADLGDAAHLDAGHHDIGAVFDADHVRGVQVDGVGVLEEIHALAELEQEPRQQHQTDKDKQSHFPCK